MGRKFIDLIVISALRIGFQVLLPKNKELSVVASYR